MIMIGFIGLGHMGNPMVGNLLKAGYGVKVYDIAASAVKAVAVKGAIACPSIMEVAKECDFLITMLQTDEQVREVCLSL